MSENVIRRTRIDLPFWVYFDRRIQAEFPEDLDPVWTEWMFCPEKRVLRLYDCQTKAQEIPGWLGWLLGLAEGRNRTRPPVAELTCTDFDNSRSIELEIWSEEWFPIIKGIILDYCELTREDFRVPEVQINATFTKVISNKRKSLED